MICIECKCVTVQCQALDSYALWFCNQCVIKIVGSFLTSNLGLIVLKNVDWLLSATTAPTNLIGIVVQGFQEYFNQNLINYQQKSNCIKQYVVFSYLMWGMVLVKLEDAPNL